MENDDGHRSAPEKDHGSPPEVPGTSTGAFTPLTINYTKYTVYHSAAAGSGAVVAGQLPMPPRPEMICFEMPLEDGGIVVGEITAWRVWRLHEEPDGCVRLKSVSMTNLWQPDGPMIGDPDYCKQDAYGISREGVYAFKTYDDMMSNFGVALAWQEMMKPVFVYGEVSLWGRVVEHERGYRAEYARPKTLYKGRAMSDKAYKLVCDTYGVEPQVDNRIDPEVWPFRMRRHRRDNADLAMAMMLGVMTVMLATLTIGLVSDGDTGAIVTAFGMMVGSALTWALAHKWWKGD